MLFLMTGYNPTGDLKGRGGGGVGGEHRMSDIISCIHIVSHSYIKNFHDIFTHWLVILIFNKIWNWPSYLWNHHVGRTCVYTYIMCVYIHVGLVAYKNIRHFIKNQKQNNAYLQTWMEQFLLLQEGTISSWNIKCFSIQACQFEI